MKTKLAAACFVIGTLLAPVAAFAVRETADHSQPTALVKDSVISTKIKAKLAQEKIASLRNIKVDTDANGAVLLRGKVKTREEVDQALSMAWDTEGVTSVTSKIQFRRTK